jgi:hypothetical protein
MSKVFIEESTLTAIGDAIRGKTGGTELIAPLDMPSEITGIVSGSDPVVEALVVTSNGTYTAPDGVDGYTPVTVNVPQEGAPSAEDLSFSGDCAYLFANGRFKYILDSYKNLITLNNVSGMNYIFYNVDQEDLSSLTINLKGSTIGATYLFSSNDKLKKLPNITFADASTRIYTNQATYWLKGCTSLSEEEMINFFNKLEGRMSATTIQSNGSFCSECHQIRDSTELGKAMKKMFSNSITSSSFYFPPMGMFYDCRNMDVLYCPLLFGNNYKATSNRFPSTSLGNLNRVKSIVFETNEDGTPIVCNMKSQTIDLASYPLGYINNDSNPVISYAGISEDKRIYDDASYQALKNDPDCYVATSAAVEYEGKNNYASYLYSRYNHDSAVETINTLPDTSAYLATAGGTNTIKFKGVLGGLTDGGAINTLTEEEIAVAAAKGWTVTLA